MALYEYKCGGCEGTFDLMRSMQEADELAECPECGALESRRLVSNFVSVTLGEPAASSKQTMPIGGGGCCGGSCCS